jgi:hypothetical protein
MTQELDAFRAQIRAMRATLASTDLRYRLVEVEQQLARLSEQRDREHGTAPATLSPHPPLRRQWS